MLLAIDIGNSEIVFGVFDGTKLIVTWRLASSLRRTVDEYTLLIDSALKRYMIEALAVKSVIVATVSPQILPLIEAACSELFDGRPVVVGPGIKTKMKIRFEPASDLSGDRIANAVAAYYLHGQRDSIVVDFGTATAFDVISSKGEYLGGALTPGLKVCAEALVGRTSRIPRVELAAPPSAIGRNTSQALQSGLVLGHVAMLEGMLRRLKCEIGPAIVIATGDSARLFAGLTKQLDVVDPHLTLQGLRLIAHFNNPVD